MPDSQRKRDTQDEVTREEFHFRRIDRRGWRRSYGLFESLTTVRRNRPAVVDANGKPRKVDSCYIYAANREIVMHCWPAFYTGPPTPSK